MATGSHHARIRAIVQEELAKKRAELAAGAAITLAAQPVALPATRQDAQAVLRAIQRRIST